MFYNLLKCRRDYLYKNKNDQNKSIINDYYFKDGINECIKGDSLSFSRSNFLKKQKKFLEGKQVTFTYDPNKPKSNCQKIRYQNSSGNIVKEKKNKCMIYFTTLSTLDHCFQLDRVILYIGKMKYRSHISSLKCVYNSLLNNKQIEPGYPVIKASTL